MKKLLETLRVKNGRAINLPWHQRRVLTASARFGVRPVVLGSIRLPRQTCRCRVIYQGGQIESIEYPPLAPRLINSLKLVGSRLDYTHKYADRSQLNTLFEQRDKNDDVLIVRDGLITDTTVGNVAFFDGSRWLTPRRPVLKGTVRARLVSGGFLKPATLSADMLDRFWLVAVMNAVTGFYVIGRVQDVIQTVEKE